MRMRGGQGRTAVATPGGWASLFGPLCLVALAVCALSAAAGTRDHLKRPPEWFASPEGARIAANVLSWQSEAGSWPKNMDPAAPPLWARFYELGTGRPLFVDRDGVPKYALADIGPERRNGYAWLGNWPAALLEREHPAWKARWP